MLSSFINVCRDALKLKRGKKTRLFLIGRAWCYSIEKLYVVSDRGYI